MGRLRWVKFHRSDLLLAILSAVFLCLTFPKFDLAGFAWIALVPLLLAIEGKALRETFVICFITGFLSCIGIFAGVAYVPSVNVFSFSILGAYLALYLTFWGLGLNWIRSKVTWPLPLIAPPLWVALEFCRAHFFFLGLPLSQLGHSQYQMTSLIQITSITGAYGLSFLIVFINTVIAEILLWVSASQGGVPFLRMPRYFPKTLWFSIGIGFFMLVGALGYGFTVLEGEKESEQVRIALIQGNVPRSKQWAAQYRNENFTKHADLTRQAMKHDPQLVVWPESAISVDVKNNVSSRKKIEALAQEIKRFLFVGSSVQAKFEEDQRSSTNLAFAELQKKFLNSMVLFSPMGHIEGTYSKIGLVPFGEYSPLEEYIDWPQFLVSDTGNSLRGRNFTMFNIGTSTFGSLICWEIQFAELFRELVQRGAGFIVNANNEIYFGDSPITYQYLALSAILAAQHKRAVARIGNTGVTAFIDPFGRIFHRLRGAGDEELFVEGFLVGDVPVTTEMTFYTRYGEVFAFTQIVLCIFFFFFVGFRNKFFLFSGQGVKLGKFFPR